MNPIPFEVGRVVLSTQGRDKGRLFVIVAVTQDDYVLVADGDLRKAESPKRKKTKHLHAKPMLFPVLSQKLKSGQPVVDSELRKALKEAGSANHLTPCKEGCVLVQE